MKDRAESLASRLDDIAAELDDFAYDNLRDALAKGATKRPDSDKQLAQARRAVEKAARALRQVSSGDPGDDEFA